LALDYFLGLDTSEDLSALLQSMRRHIGGTVESSQLSGIPGLFVVADRLDPARPPVVYEEEGLRATTSIDFTLQAETPDERIIAMRHMFVAAANLPVDVDCDALLTFQYDVACLRRTHGKLELFSHWTDWQDPWVAERLPDGYVLSDEVPRY
jgi:hypothetical protein